MDTNFWTALVAQLPLIAAIMTALNRGWLYIGRSVDQERKVRDDARAQERLDATARLEFVTGLYNTAVQERREAEDRLEKATLALKDNADVMRRSVDLNERTLDELKRWQENH